jgi:hypothetical protein
MRFRLLRVVPAVTLSDLPAGANKLRPLSATHPRPGPRLPAARPRRQSVAHRTASVGLPIDGDPTLSAAANVTIPICLRAISSAPAVAFGSIWTEASPAGPPPGTPALPWSCILNSSGQTCWLGGSTLTQEIWSRPSAFIRERSDSADLHRWSQLGDGPCCKLYFLPNDFDMNRHSLCEKLWTHTFEDCKGMRPELHFILRLG